MQRNTPCQSNCKGPLDFDLFDEYSEHYVHPTVDSDSRGVVAWKEHPVQRRRYCLFHVVNFGTNPELHLGAGPARWLPYNFGRLVQSSVDDEVWITHSEHDARSL